MSSDLLTQAKTWLEKDPDPATKSKLSQLIDNNNTKELQTCFNGRLEFGTAGLRGVMGVGPSKMNVSTVAMSSRHGEQLLIILPFDCYDSCSPYSRPPPAWQSIS